MKQNYNDCLNRLLKDEGGYTNNPNDSGGPTNFGITLGDYKKYIDKNGTAVDVKNMTVAQAKAIYKPKYWDALGCDSLASGVDYMCFNYGVISGLGRPRKALQRFKSLKGSDLIDAIYNEQVTFFKSISGGKNAVFLKGWLARASRVKSYSHFLNANSKDNTTGPVAGGAVVGFGGAISQYWHSHETAIIIGAVLLAVLVGTIVHMYKNKDIK
jgi:lysozyme family protein